MSFLCPTLISHTCNNTFIHVYLIYIYIYIYNMYILSLDISCLTKSTLRRVLQSCKVVLKTSIQMQKIGRIVYVYSRAKRQRDTHIITSITHRKMTWFVRVSVPTHNICTYMRNHSISTHSISESFCTCVNSSDHFQNPCACLDSNLAKMYNHTGAHFLCRTKLYFISSKSISWKQLDSHSKLQVTYAPDVKSADARTATWNHVHRKKVFKFSHESEMHVVIPPQTDCALIVQVFGFRLKAEVYEAGPFYRSPRYAPGSIFEYLPERVGEVMCVCMCLCMWAQT